MGITIKKQAPRNPASTDQIAFRENEAPNFSYILHVQNPIAIQTTKKTIRPSVAISIYDNPNKNDHDILLKSEVTSNE